MANAVLAYTNLADDDAATVSASSAITLAPATNLQNPHVGRKWRGSNGDSESILTDLGSAQSADTFAVISASCLIGGVERNLSSLAVTRIRLSLTDPTGALGEVYDSGSAAGRIEQAYGYLLHLLDDPVTFRYALIDLAETGATYIEAGRLFIGLRTEVGINFAPGWSRAYVDRSRKTEGRGGQEFYDLNNNYRTVDVTFEFLSEDERNGFVEDIDRVNGEHVDLLFVADPDSTNLGRDSLWGHIDGNTPVTQPYVYSPAAFTKTYKLRERR